MNRTLRVFFAALMLCIGTMSTAQAGQTRAERYCSQFKSDRILKHEKSKSDGVQLESGKLLGVGVGGGLKHSRSESTEQQALPEDVIRKEMRIYRACMEWKSGPLKKKDFKAFLLNERGIKSDQDRKDEAAAGKQARRDQRQREKDERARIRAKSRAKTRRWVALGSAAVALGGGALVLTTTQTARDTQAVYGPENEWDDLKRLNTYGWYAAAGGLVIMKISLSAGGPGFAIHGAF